MIGVLIVAAGIVGFVVAMYSDHVNLGAVSGLVILFGLFMCVAEGLGSLMVAG